MSFDAVLFYLLAYVAGSVPFGLLLAKASGVGDIRKQGSGNIGATNMARVGGKKLGLLTLMLDAAKGAVVLLLAPLLYGPLPQDVLWLAAFFAVVGHIFPLWLKGKGGKGVATTLAVITTLHWVLGLMLLGMWLVVFLVTRTSSLSAIIAMAVLLLGGWMMPDLSTMAASVASLLALLVIYRHKENIERLLKGQEKAFRK